MRSRKPGQSRQASLYEEALRTFSKRKERGFYVDELLTHGKLQRDHSRKMLRLFEKTKFNETNTDIKPIYNKFIAFKIMLSKFLDHLSNLYKISMFETCHFPLLIVFLESRDVYLPLPNSEKKRITTDKAG